MGLNHYAYDPRERHQIGRSANHTITIGIGTNTQTENIRIQGQLLAVIYDAPALDTDTSFTLTITDQDDLTVYTATYSHNTKGIDWVVDSTTRVCYGLMKVTVSCTTAQSSDKEFTVAFVLK